MTLPTLTEAQVHALVARDPELAAEYLRRKELELGLTKRQFIEAFHAKQREAFEDPSKRKSICCSRRAGKSEFACGWLLDKAERVPGGLSIYVMLTRNNCRQTPWNTFARINDRHDLGLWLHERDGQLIVEHPNGHVIWLAGCKHQAEVGKFRGGGGQTVAGYTAVVVDEAQNYGPFITELIDDALIPGLMDQDGDLMLLGTPGPVPAGYFYESSQEGKQRGWGTHHWTVLDNPYVPNAERWMREFREAKGWAEDHPTFLREYRGLWVRDDNALVYPYDASLNAFTDELPEDHWIYGLGVDLGYDDATAFVVACYRRDHPEIYYVHAEKHRGLIPSKVAAHVNRLQREWGISRTVVDTGGFGKGYFEEMQQTYGIAAEPAAKANKRAYQELLAGDLKSGSVKVNPFKARSLVDEWQVLQWDEAGVIEDEKFENHCSDAALYLHRKLRASYRPRIDNGKPERSDEFRAAVAAAKKRKKERWR